jgi:hypothetical protein
MSSNLKFTMASPSKDLYENITKSKQLLSNIFPQLNTTIGEAAMVAAKSINSTVYPIAVVPGNENGSLVYDIWLVDSKVNNIYNVQIDIGNGKVLSSQNTLISNSSHPFIKGVSKIGNKSMPWPLCRITDECPKPF